MTSGPVDGAYLAAGLRRLLPQGVAVVASAGEIDDGPLFAVEASAVREACAARRAEFATGRALARRAMGDLGHPPAPVPVGRGREPVWPVGLAGSISHSAGWFVAAVAERRGCWALGIDVESCARLSADALAALRRFVLSAEERRSIGTDRWAALEIFSAKEAAFKALSPYAEHSFSLGAFRAVARTPGQLALRLTRPLGGRLPAGTAVPVRLHRGCGIVLAAAFLSRPPRTGDRPEGRDDAWH
ncbi:4'-phosphopantetheinyl transferase [Kitasatospora sp. NPDC048296]|uniref:4'-phosphopantetheinyl transferase family protein n=1 Tax=Kitasatospora sp. NPDC048296 TaxID=3364048 RepID=UPI00371A98F2